MNTAIIHFEEFGFDVHGVSCGRFDGSFEYDYQRDEVTEVYLSGFTKIERRWKEQSVELPTSHPLWRPLVDALLEQFESDIDHATPEHLQARYQRNQDALRTIALSGVRTC